MKKSVKMRKKSVSMREKSVSMKKKRVSMIKGAREGRLHGIKGFVEIKGGLQCHAEKWETGSRR